MSAALMEAVTGFILPFAAAAVAAVLAVVAVSPYLPAARRPARRRRFEEDQAVTLGNSWRPPGRRP